MHCCVAFFSKLLSISVSNNAIMEVEIQKLKFEVEEHNGYCVSNARMDLLRFMDI